MNKARDVGAVLGYCPMGCGTTLHLVDGGHVTCTFVGCPDPEAVTTLLAERETEHLVTFHTNTFTVRHPLRERLDDALMRCELHDYCFNLDGPPAAPGLYRAVRDDAHRWTFVAVER